MKVYVVLELVDLGSNVQGVWATEALAEEARDILTKAYRLFYPKQNWKYQYTVEEHEVREELFSEDAAGNTPYDEGVFPLDPLPI